MRLLSVVMVVMTLVSVCALPEQALHQQPYNGPAEPMIPLRKGGMNAPCRSKWECYKRGHYFKMPFHDCVNGKCASCHQDTDCKPTQFCNYEGWAIICQDRPQENMTDIAPAVVNATKATVEGANSANTTAHRPKAAPRR